MCPKLQFPLELALHRNQYRFYLKAKTLHDSENMLKKVIFAPSMKETDLCYFWTFRV